MLSSHVHFSGICSQVKGHLPGLPGKARPQLVEVRKAPFVRIFPGHHLFIAAGLCQVHHAGGGLASGAGLAASTLQAGWIGSGWAVALAYTRNQAGAILGNLQGLVSAATSRNTRSPGPP